MNAQQKSPDSCEIQVKKLELQRHLVMRWRESRLNGDDSGFRDNFYWKFTQKLLEVHSILPDKASEFGVVKILCHLCENVFVLVHLQLPSLLQRYSFKSAHTKYHIITN